MSSPWGAGGGLIGLCCVTYLHALVLDFKQVFFAQKPPAGVTVSVSLNGRSPDASRGATSQREDAVSLPAEPPEAAAQGLFVSESRQTAARALSAPKHDAAAALKSSEVFAKEGATQLGSRGQCRPQRPGAGRPKPRPFSVQWIYIETQRDARDHFWCRAVE